MPDLSPWEGIAVQGQQPAAPTPGPDRNTPLESRALRDAQILAGQAGDPLEHAVRFKDVQEIEARLIDTIQRNADIFNASLVRLVQAQFGAIDTEARGVAASLDEAIKSVSEATGQSISDLSASIQGEIARLDQADATLSTNLTAQIDQAIADLDQNYYTIAQTDAAISALSTDLSTQIGAVQSSLATDYYTRSGTDTAIAAATTALETQINDATAALLDDYYTAVETDTAIAAATTALEAQIGTTTATALSNYYTKAETDSAIAAVETSVGTEIDGLSTTVSSFQGAIDGIEGVHAIRINNNGHISGFGLISSIRDGLPVSDFIVSDASFKVVNSAGAGSYTPFAVFPTTRVVDGVTVPAGVYAQELFVTNANIQTLSGDKITANTITSDKIAANAVTADKIAAGSVTAGKISVADLSAVSANLGSIQVGNANIQDAAITSAKISNLAVDTLKIAGNAVTIFRNASGTVSNTANGVWTDVAIITFAPSDPNAMLLILFEASHAVTGRVAGENSPDFEGRCRISWRGSVLKTFNQVQGDMNYVGTVLAGSGATSLRLQNFYTRDAFTTGGITTVGTLIVGEIKR